jgi:hypothetical protein
MSKEGVKQAQECRKPRKRVKLDERDGLVGKPCSECKKWKILADFRNTKTGLGKCRSNCKSCEAAQKRRKYNEDDAYRQRDIERNRTWHKVNQEKASQKNHNYFINNREKALVRNHRRLATKKNLPSLLTTQNLTEIYNYFGGCALTGDKIIHLDHVIPLSVGRGGTIYGNVIPLRADLNISKSDNNIFEWFEANRQRFELSQERFDNLIAYLASANAMTIEEYRDHVYWCHANPRNIDELEAQ